MTPPQDPQSDRHCTGLVPHTKGTIRCKLQGCPIEPAVHTKASFDRPAAACHTHTGTVLDNVVQMQTGAGQYSSFLRPLVMTNPTCALNSPIVNKLQHLSERSPADVHGLPGHLPSQRWLPKLRCRRCLPGRVIVVAFECLQPLLTAAQRLAHRVATNPQREPWSQAVDRQQPWQIALQRRSLVRADLYRRDLHRKISPTRFRQLLCTGLKPINLCFWEDVKMAREKPDEISGKNRPRESLRECCCSCLDVCGLRLLSTSLKDCRW